MKTTISAIEQQHLSNSAPEYPLLRLTQYLRYEIDDNRERPKAILFREKIQSFIEDFCKNPCLETAKVLKDIYDNHASLIIDLELPFGLNNFFKKELPNLIKKYQSTDITTKILLEVSSHLLKEIKKPTHQYANNLVHGIEQFRNPIIGEGVCQGFALAKCYDILKNEGAIKQPFFSDDETAFYLRAETYQCISHLRYTSIYSKHMNTISTQIKHNQDQILDKLLNGKANQTKPLVEENNQLRMQHKQIEIYEETLKQQLPLITMVQGKLSLTTPKHASNIIASEILNILQAIPENQSYAFNLSIAPNNDDATGHSIGFVKTKENLFFIDANLGVFKFDINKTQEFIKFVAWELHEIGYCHIFNTFSLENWPELEDQLNTPEVLKFQAQNRQPATPKSKIVNIIDSVRDGLNYINTDACTVSSIAINRCRLLFTPLWNANPRQQLRNQDQPIRTRRNQL